MASEKDDIIKLTNDVAAGFYKVQEAIKQQGGNEKYKFTLPQYENSHLSKVAKGFKGAFTKGLEDKQQEKMNALLDTPASKTALASIADQVNAHMKNQFNSLVAGNPFSLDSWKTWQDGIDQISGAVRKQSEALQTADPANKKLIQSWEDNLQNKITAMREDAISQEAKQRDENFKKSKSDKEYAQSLLLFKQLHVGDWNRVDGQEPKSESDSNEVKVRLKSGVEIKLLQDGVYHNDEKKYQFDIVLKGDRASIIRKPGSAGSIEEYKALVDILAGGKGAEVVEFDVPSEQACRPPNGAKHLKGVMEAAKYATKNNVEVEIGNALVAGLQKWQPSGYEELRKLLQENKEILAKNLAKAQVESNASKDAERRQVDTRIAELKTQTAELKNLETERAAFKTKIDSGASLTDQGKFLLENNKGVMDDKSVKEGIEKIVTRINDLEKNHEFLQAEIAHLKEDINNNTNLTIHPEREAMQQELFSELKLMEEEYKKEHEDLQARVQAVQDADVKRSATALTPSVNVVTELGDSPIKLNSNKIDSPLQATFNEFRDAAKTEAEESRKLKR